VDVGVGLVGSADVGICGANGLSDFLQGHRLHNPVAGTIDHVQMSVSNCANPVSGVGQGHLSLQINMSASGRIWFETSGNVSGHSTYYYQTTSRYMRGNCNIFPFGLHGYLEGTLFTLG